MRLQEIALGLFKLALRFEQFLITRTERWIYFPRAARKLKNLLNIDVETVLDLGSGLGYWADALKKVFLEAQFISADVENRHQGDSQFVLLQPNQPLPFENNQFDLVSIIFVLHHIDSPLQTLKEVKRICRGVVVIHEDTYSNIFQKLLYSLHVTSYRLTLTLSGGMKVRTDAEWLELFGQSGFVVLHKRRIHKIGYPVRRFEYILKPE